MNILFKTDKIIWKAELNKSKTAEEIYKNLPFVARIKVWQEEIYFDIPLKLKPENPTLDVEVGDVAYWVQGSCLCIFFGRTPLSTTDKPVPASEVEIIGRLLEDCLPLKNFKEGERIVVERLNGL